MELHDTNRTLQRPKNFIFKLRSEVYCFKDDSINGILKRIPIKNGSYKVDELETLHEKSDSAKIWTDVTLNSSGSLKANKNSSATQNDDSYESKQHDQMKECVLKLRGAIARCKLRESKNLALLDVNENVETKKDDIKQLKETISQDPMEETFCKTFKEPINKKQLLNFVETDSGMFKECALNERDEQFSAFNKNSSSKQPDVRKDNRKYLSKTWTESSLTAALNKISIKPRITEL